MGLITHGQDATKFKWLSDICLTRKAIKESNND